MAQVPGAPTSLWEPACSRRWAAQRPPAILVQTTVLRPVSQPRLLATRWLPPGCEPGGAVGQVRPLRQDVTKYALYTTSIFVGGAAGSAIASSLYEQGGWGLIMQVGSAVALVGLVVFILLRRR